MLPEEAKVKDLCELGKLQELPSSDGCFVCGQDNPSGLHIRFFTDGEVAYGEYVPPDGYQGYEGNLHGGILSTLLDEIMAKALAAQGITVVTGKLELRFRQAAPTGEKLLIKGWVKSQKAGSYKAAGEITGEEGQVLVEAEGLFFPRDHQELVN
jgi:acyl-coenzyme A thioesterase PaaI-like protein